MKRFFSASVLFVVLMTVLGNFNIVVTAYDPAIPFSTFSYDKNGNLVQSEYIEVWENEKADKNFTLQNNQNIRITTLDSTEGKLVIKNGASVVVKGEIFIERGGVLEIENGTVIINGGNITNCGTIKIGKKGALKVQSGTLNSTAAGTIQSNGSIACLSSGKKINSCFNSIKKYDSNFNLSDYSLLINSKGNSAKITMNYCINDIMTNYKYSIAINTKDKKIKIVHSNYSLKTVYNSQTAQKLQERVSSFEKSHTKELNFKMWYWQDYGYSYDYKSKELVYNAKWVSYDNLKDEFLDNSFSEKV